MSKAYSRTVKNKGMALKSSGESKHRDALVIAEKSKQLITIQERTAGDKFNYRNWLVPEAMAFWPSNPNLWHVDQMFPYAKGGKLLVDEPRTAEDKRECQVKKQQFEKWGYNYFVVEHEEPN